MNIFSKYLLKSIMEKKGRTILLLASISISTALLIASLGAIETLMNILLTQQKGHYGEFNIQIKPDRSLEVPIFRPVDLNNKDMEKNFRGISIGGYLSSDDEKEFILTGTTISYFNNFESMHILEKGDLEPFRGKKLIISEKTSKSLNVNLGDELKLKILGKDEKYKIVAISMNKGMFFYDRENKFQLIAPEEKVFSQYNERGKYSIELATVNSNDLDTWIKDFNDKYKYNKIIASKTYDEQAMREQLNWINTPLFFMLGIVLLMSTFIIYSSFKLIIVERLPVVGVFLSQGATKGGVMKILLKESLTYGVLGGIIGILIGVGITSAIAYFTNPFVEYGIKATIELNSYYLIIGFIFAIVLSMISGLIPTLSIRKLPVKDVILNKISTSSDISLRGFISGFILIICAIILYILRIEIKHAGSIPSVFIAFIGTILIIPKLVDIASYPLVRFLRNINGLSMLSFNNVRTSKVLINNMTLIVVSVVSIIMITSLSTSISEEIKGAYNQMNYEVSVIADSNNTRNINRLVNRYKDAFTINESGLISTNLDGDNSKPINMYYVDPEKYKAFETYMIFNDKEKELNELNENRDGIIISRRVAINYNIKKGDTITVAVDDRKEELTVLSIFNPKMYSGGNYNLISKKAALRHFKIKYPTEYFISTKVSQIEAKKGLEEKLKGLGAYVTTKNEIIKEQDENMKQLTGTLKTFSYLTMLIGGFGIINNVSISFIQRKREMAVISSIGLTTGGRGYMILLESIFQALIGIIISLVAAFGINILFKDVLKFLMLDFNLKYPYEAIIPVSLVTIFLMITVSLSSVLKSRKLQIVKELKYE